MNKSRKDLGFTKTRLFLCKLGYRTLILFLCSFLAIFAVLLGIFLLNPAAYEMGVYWKQWVLAFLLILLLENVIFWTGIVTVYVTSEQLGIKWRVIGVLCGWIPIANLVALGKIIQVSRCEVKTERHKILLNETRKEEQICKTKYPLLMVHGVFFRDLRYFNYWGRIPKQLEMNGATLFYGNQQSASSVIRSAEELAERIKQIVKETGCEKLNIIAHSKGGLDSRYAIANLGIDEYVASLTTINTPHRGCIFADYLLSKIPEKQKQGIAQAYNRALRRLGDKDPDFISAVTDLTASACEKLNETVPDNPKVYYQSVGSKLNVARGGQFPLNLSTRFIKHFDGPNDGLVGEESFVWGEHYEFLTVKGKRGISHGDMIDLNRENFDGFDVREFFVQLVADLKKRGY